MSARAERSPRPPLLLALIHLVVFGGAASAAIGASLPEWLQLDAVLRRPYAMGERPHLTALLGSVLALALLLALAAKVVARRTVPLALSAAILVCAGLTLWPAAPPRFRSWGASDQAILLTAQRVQRDMVERLQSKGEVPTDPAAWREALERAAVDPLPATAHLRRLAYRLEARPWESPLPPGLAPGTVVVRISPDGAAFALNPVGFDPQGNPAFLRDERGALLTLRGLFNPNRAPGPATFSESTGF